MENDGASSATAPDGVQPDAGRRIVAEHSYEGEYDDDNPGDGPPLLFEVVEFDDGSRLARLPDETLCTIDDVPDIPHALCDLSSEIARSAPIFIVANEREIDAVDSLTWREKKGGSIYATCSARGAGRWSDTIAGYFRNADAVIVPINSDAGRRDARSIARTLQGKAARIRILDLPGVPGGGGVAEWVKAGGNARKFLESVERAPDWRPLFSSVRLGEEDGPPERAWLVKGLLSGGDLSVLFGPSGSGKSFLAVDLSARIAGGLPWFDRQVSAGAVIYVAGEGAAGLRLRMKAWRDTFAPGIRLPLVMVPAALDLRSNATAAQELAEAALQHAAAVGTELHLIVLDTLSRMLGGGSDAEPRDMAAFLVNIGRIREMTGAHVLVVHHTGKDETRGMRGSSTLRDYADTAIEICTTGESFKATVDKQKDDQAGAVFCFRLRQVVIGQDSDGSDLTSCVILPVEASEGETASKSRSPKGEATALLALDTALAASGEHSPGGPIPSSARITRIDSWRETYYRTDTSCRDAAARRQAFRRARQALEKKGLVTTLEPYAWRA